jgi:site-specific DNA recombinase
MPSTNGHGPQRAILYARVSTDEQARSGYSLFQQLEALREYASREGYEVLEEVADPGQSGASLERPGMDRVRDLVAAGGVSVVLAQDRDRFSREPAYTYLLRREFDERGCVMHALNDRGDNTPEGELTDGILDQLAKYERAKIAERSRRGLLKKAREGRLVGTARPKYGFRYNEERDGFVLYEPEMLVVEKIFRLAAEGFGVRAIQKRLHQEGVRTQKGGTVWARAVIQRLIFDDAYRPHDHGEILELVSTEVSSRLDPNKDYGVEWYNRQKVVTRTVSVGDGNGGRTYKKRQIRTLRPREEWVAIPVPTYLSCSLVEAARTAFEANKGTERKYLARPWELRGLMRCTCGWKMGTHTTKGRTKDRLYYYYECRHRRMHGSMSACSQKSINAPKVEASVWEFVSELLKDPARIRAGMNRLIDQERASGHAEPEREARAWLEKLSDVDRQRARAQNLAVEGLLDPDELRAKLAELADVRETAERELEGLQDRRQRVEELESDRDALIESMVKVVPEEIDKLSGVERNKVYRMLRLEVSPTPVGAYSVEGAFCTSELISST